jgi:hypothetical protein
VEEGEVVSVVSAREEETAAQGRRRGLAREARACQGT